MKKVLHFIWSIMQFLIIVYVVLATAILLNKNKYGYTQFGNYTISSIKLADEREIDKVQAGDLLIVHNNTNIKKGDTIYYYVVYGEKYLIHSDSVLSIEKDDYNSVYTIDQEESFTIASSRVLGKKGIIIPKLGAILNVVESRPGFLFLVLLPIFVVFVYQVYELVLIFRYEKMEEVVEDKSKKKKTSKNKKKTKKKNKK